MTGQGEIRQRLKDMIVRRLELSMKPEEIADEVPLFADGLGLDSVEGLEIVVGIEEEFELALGDSPGLKERFRSVSTIATLVEELLREKKAVA